MIYFSIIITRENDNNNKEYCNCEVTEQLQISEDINNMTDKKNGREYLGYVLEKLKERITEISLSLVEGQKEIEGMHEYYWENYTEMDQYGYENYEVTVRYSLRTLSVPFKRSRMPLSEIPKTGSW